MVVGVESQGLLTGRASVATAGAPGLEAVVLPSNHGGLLGGEFGQQGAPEAFAARLREALDPPAPVVGACAPSHRIRVEFGG